MQLDCCYRTFLFGDIISMGDIKREGGGTACKINFKGESAAKHISQSSIIQNKKYLMVSWCIANAWFQVEAVFVIPKAKAPD